MPSGLDQPPEDGLPYHNYITHENDPFKRGDSESHTLVHLQFLHHLHNKQHLFLKAINSLKPTDSMETKRKRLLATTLDRLAEKTPDKLFAVIPQGSELTSGFRDLSMKDLAQAVNLMSWWIENTIGPAQSRETLAYMGSNDVRYFIFMLACQKTGYQVRQLTVHQDWRKANRLIVFL